MPDYQVTVFHHTSPEQPRIREAVGLAQAKLVSKWQNLDVSTCLSDFKVWAYSNTPHMCVN